jgi:hypothetical protein
MGRLTGNGHERSGFLLTNSCSGNGITPNRHTDRKAITHHLPEQHHTPKPFPQPTLTSPLASTMRPLPPQCLVESPSLTAGMPLTRTLELPPVARQVLAPQQRRCSPLSPMRTRGRPFTMTSGEPDVAGPDTPWEQQSLPWESRGHRALSSTLHTGGMKTSL